VFKNTAAKLASLVYDQSEKVISQTCIQVYITVSISLVIKFIIIKNKETRAFKIFPAFSGTQEIHYQCSHKPEPNYSNPLSRTV
jgi:hypothetical protein